MVELIKFREHSKEKF